MGRFAENATPCPVTAGRVANKPKDGIFDVTWIQSEFDDITGFNRPKLLQICWRVPE